MCGRGERRQLLAARRPAPLAAACVGLLVAGSLLGAPGRSSSSSAAAAAAFASPTSPSPVVQYDEELETNQASQGAARGPGGKQALDENFVSLFDELLRLKNTSVNALISLDYFGEARPASASSELGGAELQQTSTAAPSSRPGASEQLAAERRKQLQLQWKLAQGSRLAQAVRRLGGWLSAAAATAAAAAKQRQLKKKALLGARGPLALRPRQQPAQQAAAGQQQQQAQQEPAKGSADEAAGSLSESMSQQDRQLDERQRRRRRRRRRRRQAALQPPEQPNCVRLTIDELSKCFSVEKAINSLLNHSFPGTLASIEDNCNKITFLLASCWPQQLAQLKQSLALWNETIVMSSEFPLPLGNDTLSSAGSAQVPLGQLLASGSPSCGAGEPQQTSPAVRERVNWMWLNLCMDKKFRLDYVSNLRCLSAWSQERAQQVCASEYNQMHGYLAHQAEINAAAAVAAAAGQQPNRSVATQLVPAWQAASYAPAPTSGLTSSGSPDSGGFAANAGADRQLVGPSTTSGAAQAPSMDSRELGSKLLCCMFDQFLRCVHRQAVRECGRSRAQFVINFMSRIGTEDMKYLCNGESRGQSPAALGLVSTGSSQQQQQPSGRFRRLAAAAAATVTQSNVKKNKSQSNSRRAQSGQSQDRSPFIDSNYCFEPRIQSAIHNVSLQYGDATRVRNQLLGPTSLATKQANTSKSSARTPISPDPTFVENGDLFVVPNSALNRTTSTWLLISLILMYNLVNNHLL